MNRKITTLIFFSFLFSSFYVRGQKGIEGKIFDSKDNVPIEYATVTLFSIDSVYLSGAITDDSGYFKIPVNADIENYILSVSCLGYEKKYQNINLKTDSLISVVLDKNIKDLNEVTIIGKKSPIQNIGEKIVVNVSSYMNPSGKNTVDVLKVLPGITFENESLYLMGKSITVYINDRPSNMTGKDLFNYLSSLQGGQIEKVELLLNPTAKYDAGYSGAIVNIKLKKNETLGLNGSVSNTAAAWGENKYIMPSINLNYRSGKLNLYGGYTFLYNEFQNIIEYERKYRTIDIPLQYNEKGIYNGTMPYHSYNIGLDYSITDKHQLGILLKGTNDKSNQDNDTWTRIRNIGSENIDSLFFSPIQMNQTRNNYQGNINYTWKMDTTGTQLSADLNYMNQGSKNKQLIPIFYYLPNMQTTYRDETGFGQNVNQNMELWSGKIDYERKILNDGEINAGLKYDKIKRNNHITVFNKNNGIWTEDETQNNVFNYNENIYAAYLIFNKTLNKFYLSAGMRWELTHQKGKQEANNEKFDRDYNDWFPSASVQYNMKNSQSIMLSYNRKISRPAFSVMNPFMFYTSPQTYQIGNPELKPSYNNSVSMRYAKNRASLTLLYSSVKNQAVQEAFQDDETKILGYRYINFGSAKLFQASVYYPIQLIKWWSASLNVSGSYNNIESLLNNDNFKKDFFSYNASLYNTFQLTKGLSADLFLLFLSNRWSTATHIEPRGHAEASITKELWNDKASISLGIVDPFRWSTFRSSYIFQNIDEKTKEINNARIIKLSFTYKFGSNKIKKSQNRNTGIEDIQQRIN